MYMGMPTKPEDTSTVTKEFEFPYEENKAVIERRPRMTDTYEMEEGRLAEQQGHMSVACIDVSIEE